MDTDLSGIDRKLARAQDHLDAIKSEEAAWIEAQSEFITVKPDPNPSVPSNLVHFSLWIDAVVPIPKKVGAIVGDCIQNLRSALDHLARQLVIGNGGADTQYTSFPLLEDRLNEESDKVRKFKIAGGVDNDALVLIEAAQPYNRVEDPTEHPLWILHELSNIDKHRLVLFVAEGSTDYRIWVGLGHSSVGSMTKTGRQATMPLKAGTKVGGFGTTPESFQMYPYVKGQIFPRIAFGEGEVCAFQPVTAVLEEVAKAVRGVIDSLRPYTFPAEFHAPVAPSTPMSREAIARSRALNEASGEIWPWTDGPLAVPADHDWVAQQDFPELFFGSGPAQA